MVFEAHCMSSPCTELLLFNYAEVFPFYGTFNDTRSRFSDAGSWSNDMQIN